MSLDDPGLQLGCHERKRRHGLVLTWLRFASPLRCHKITNRPLQGSMLAEPTEGWQGPRRGRGSLRQECRQIDEIDVRETSRSAPDKLELIQLGDCPNNILDCRGLCLLSLRSRELNSKASAKERANASSASRSMALSASDGPYRTALKA